jgi:hypothetical protein
VLAQLEQDLAVILVAVGATCAAMAQAALVVLVVVAVRETPLAWAALLA